jgi:hypothetical protein
MKFKQNILAVSVVAGITALAGCSSDSDNDARTTTADGSGETVQGRITGFGSIYVNGIEYETDDALITVDGAPATEDDLDLGMMVTLRGESSGSRGNAYSVDYDDDLDGVLTNVNLDQNGMGTIDVMGYAVTLDANTLVEFYTNNISDLNQAVYNPNTGIQYVVEVSGYSDGQGNIHATRVEVKEFDGINGYLELKGFVQSHDSATSTFWIADTQVVYSEATRYDDMSNAMLTDGLHVEVKGQGFDAQGRFIADEIENESVRGLSGGDMDDDYEIEGVVASLSADSFTLNGYTIYYDQSTIGVDILAEGAIVEVDAYYDDQSRLFAEEIDADELYDDYHNGLEMKSTVQSVDLANNTLEVMGKTIYVTGSTMIRDEYSNIRYFSLSDINWSAGNQYVEVKAYADPNGNLVASKLTYEGVGNGETEELEGPLTVDETGANVMGIVIDFGSLPNPGNGMKVEMTGVFSSGMFYASTLEAESMDD